MIMNGHKKTRASCLLFKYRHLEIARQTIIEQQPALIRYNTAYPLKWQTLFYIRNQRKHLLSIIPFDLKFSRFYT